MPKPKKAPVPKKKKVLIVEDDAVVSRILEQLVRGLDADACVAEDGASGISMARSERPDLVLVDIHLPGMNGLEVIREIRATPKLAALPIIVITGDSTAEFVRQTAMLGANDFLVKANVLAGDAVDRIRRHLAPAKRKTDA